MTHAGALILHRFGVPTKLIAEREFNLSFLNTAVDALALIVFGVGLATSILSGERRPLLTVLPAAVGATGIAAALLIARRASSHAERLHAKHPKIASALTTLANAVDDTERLLVHRGSWTTVLGWWPTSDSTCLSCGLPSSPSMPTQYQGPQL